MHKIKMIVRINLIKGTHIFFQKSQRKQVQMYVVLYNFKGKEKDDLDLR